MGLAWRLRSKLSDIQIFQFKILKIFLMDKTFKVNDFKGVDWSSLTEALLNDDLKIADELYLNFNDEIRELRVSKSYADSFHFNPKSSCISLIQIFEEHYMAFENYSVNKVRNNVISITDKLQKIK